MKDCIQRRPKKNTESYDSNWKGRGISSYGYEDYEALNQSRNSYIEPYVSFVGWKFVLSDSSLASPIERKFNELAAKWKKETGLYSTTFDKINDTYLDIMALGTEVVVYMLKDMQKPTGTAHWHTALKSFAKSFSDDDINPIPPEDLDKPKKIKQGWIDWGKRNNLL